jgi:hypothetical protein
VEAKGLPLVAAQFGCGDVGPGRLEVACKDLENGADIGGSAGQHPLARMWPVPLAVAASIKACAICA